MLRSRGHSSNYEKTPDQLRIRPLEQLDQITEEPQILVAPLATNSQDQCNFKDTTSETILPQICVLQTSVTAPAPQPKNDFDLIKTVSQVILITYLTWVDIIRSKNNIDDPFVKYQLSQVYCKRILLSLGKLPSLQNVTYQQSSALKAILIYTFQQDAEVDPNFARLTNSPSVGRSISMMRISNKASDKKDSRFHVFSKAHHRQMAERYKKEAYLDMVAAMMKVYRCESGRENFDAVKEDDSRRRRTIQVVELLKTTFVGSFGREFAGKVRRSLVQIDRTYQNFRIISKGFLIVPWDSTSKTYKNIFRATSYSKGTRWSSKFDIPAKVINQLNTLIFKFYDTKESVTLKSSVTQNLPILGSTIVALLVCVVAVLAMQNKTAKLAVIGVSIFLEACCLLHSWGSPLDSIQSLQKMIYRYLELANNKGSGFYFRINPDNYQIQVKDLLING